VSLTGGVASYGTATLVVGNHSITARYNGDASNPARTSPVLTQNVKGGAAPVVSITSPADQTVYDYPAAVAMLASASTSGGRTLNDVVFFREGAGSSGFAVGGTSPAYNTTWSGLPAGTHVFRARASDNTGAVTLSAPITVQLVVPPSPPAVALSAPAPGTQYTLPATVGLVAAATPGTGASVTKVEFFQGTTLLATDTAAPYGFDWVNPPTGDYSLSAKVTDSAQMSATSDPVAISVRLSGPGETVTFLHSDAAGNALAATDETGNALWKEAYRPYGRRVRFEAGSAGARLWFHGKAQDAETGLQYFGARYYDPFLGRFYGADPKGFDEGNIHSFNRYAYGNNNPLRFTDPDGNQGFPIHLLRLPGYAAGGAGSAGGTPGLQAGPRPEALPGFEGADVGSYALPPKAAVEPVSVPRLPGFMGVVQGIAEGLVFNSQSAGGGAKVENLSPADRQRIQGAADRNNVEISVVGGRARGVVGPSSDYDYVLNPDSTRLRKKLKNSLPEGPRGLGEKRNLDFHDGPVDANEPHITFTPQKTP
jgi:RHS repeat-associated protein